MSRVHTCLKTLPWREKVGKANFFIETIFISAKLRKKLVMAKEKAEKNQINGEGHFKLAKKIEKNKEIRK